MATGQEMTHDGNTIAAIIAAISGGVVAVVSAVSQSLRIRARVSALEEALAAERAARAALEDAIGARVSAEVARAVAELPKPKALPPRSASGSMPSVESLRALVREETERVARARDEEHERDLGRIGGRIDSLYDRIVDLATRGS